MFLLFFFCVCVFYFTLRICILHLTNYCYQRHSHVSSVKKLFGKSISGTSLDLARSCKVIAMLFVGYFLGEVRQHIILRNQYSIKRMQIVCRYL